ncbi:hypothetical protein KR044_010946, partial [Drosophila immigrans]
RNFTRRAAFAGLQPDLKPWKRIDWPMCFKSRLFRDLGQYYSQRLFPQKALASFQHALDVAQELEPWTGSIATHQSIGSTHLPISSQSFQAIPEAYKTLYARSKCYRRNAQNEAAYKDTVEAEHLMEMTGELRASLVLDKCDLLFDRNQFEDNICQLHNDSRKFAGQAIKARFDKHKALTLAVFEDCLGARLDPFLLQNRALMLRKRATPAAIVPRTMWQKLRDTPECDVESVTLKAQRILPPLERARRRIAENIYNYEYMGSSANDVAMLHGLRNNKVFLNPLYPQTAGQMYEFSNEKYAIVRKFMKMLHARKPLYQVSEKNRENYLYCVEYQTSRDCYRILREVRRLRLEQNVDRLTAYIEQIMSTKIELKTHRTLRWKFEFINEVYNMLGLTHIDQRAVPKGIDFLNPNNIPILYHMPKDRMRKHSSKFGGRNLYADMARDADRVARVNLVVKKLEDRLLHSRYGIERTYLMYEIARQHFKESHYGKCTTMARNAAKEAHACNNLVWRFNASFLICQVHAAFSRLERLKDSLAKANHLAEKLNSPELLAYLELCNTVN